MQPVRILILGTGGMAKNQAEHFAAMEPRLGDFLAVKRRIDPDARIASALVTASFASLGMPSLRNSSAMLSSTTKRSVDMQIWPW